MKYVIYVLVAALIVWAVWYLVKSIRRQIKGDCGCGKDCRNCGRKEKDK